MAEHDHQLITWMLLMILSFVLVMTVLAVVFVLNWRYRKGLPPSNEPAEEEPSARDNAEGRHHLSLRRPACWLAIRSRNLPAVQSALALHDPKPCSWTDGLSADAGQKLFIAPPVLGWILVIGAALPDPADDVDACFRFLMELSRKLGHVQFFSANGVLGHHGWAKVEAGRVLRAYAWTGRTIWNQGGTTPAETDIGMHCHDYFEETPHSALNTSEAGVHNVEKVHLLAARWSVDPDEIDGRLGSQQTGVVGEPSRHF